MNPLINNPLTVRAAGVPVTKPALAGAGGLMSWLFSPAMVVPLGFALSSMAWILVGGLSA